MRLTSSIISKLAKFFLLSIILGACLPKPLPTNQGRPEWGVEITWHGQSCFTLEDSTGRTVVIDPFDETVGFGRISLRADALLITHDHFDHNNKAAVHQRHREVEFVLSTGTHQVASGLGVYGLASFHDRVGGQINGPNIIYIWTMAGLKIAHLGDLGTEALTPEQVSALSGIDILFVPVGGITTLNASQAKKVVDELKPKAIFPMHYGDIRFYKLDPVEKFTSLYSPDQVKRVDGKSVRVHLADFSSSPGVFVLSPQEKNY